MLGPQVGQVNEGQQVAFSPHDCWRKIAISLKMAGGEIERNARFRGGRRGAKPEAQPHRDLKCYFGLCLPVLRYSFPFCLLRLVFRDDEVSCVLHPAATRWIGACPDQSMFRTRPAECRSAQGDQASGGNVSADGSLHEP